MVVAEKYCQCYQDKTKTFLKHQGGGVLLFFQRRRHSLTPLGQQIVCLRLFLRCKQRQTCLNSEKGISSDISRLDQVLN